jgi:uncharacterized protein YkwD
MKKEEGMRSVENMLVFLLLVVAFLLVAAYYSSVFEKDAGPSTAASASQKRLPKPEDIDFYDMERGIHAKVNAERAKSGLDDLLWSDELAAVAREHSEDLADENKPLTEFNLSCHRPFIHHEGFDFGLYHYDRLVTRGVYSFNYSGENIFITSGWSSLESLVADYPEPCPDDQTIVTSFDTPEDVLNKLEELKRYVSSSDRISWTAVEWHSQDELERYVVDGWLSSPGHKELMLDDGFDEAGIGVAKVNDFYIVTQVFINRLECGYNGGQCCVQEGYYPSCYTPLNCVDGTCQS